MPTDPTPTPPERVATTSKSAGTATGRVVPAEQSHQASAKHLLEQECQPVGVRPPPGYLAECATESSDSNWGNREAIAAELDKVRAEIERRRAARESSRLAKAIKPKEADKEARGYVQPAENSLQARLSELAKQGGKITAVRLPPGYLDKK